MNSEADRIIALYERHAHDWHRDRGSGLILERAWLDRFTALMPHGAAILDLGCGSGQPIAKDLIERGFPVTGVDTSPTLISLCRSRFPDKDWIVSDMRAISLETKFQGIIAWDSFFHLAHDDQRHMFPIFRNHAARGAALLFTSGPSHGEAIGAYCGEPLFHASLSESEYDSLLQSNGFVVRGHVAEDPDCGRHTVWLAQKET